MRSSLKKILSFVLSLVMVLSLVPMTALATETETTSDYVAINTATGATYATVSDACDEAQAGQTVQLTSDSTEDIIVVDEQITLDLAGCSLTADYVASYGDIIDSSEDNTGLLTVPADHLMLESDNTQLPVKDSNGYRFVEIIGFNTAMINENKYAFQPLFEAAAHKYLTADAGFSVQVDVSWLQNGADMHAQFAYTSELVQTYVGSYNAETGKYSKMFTLTKQSTGYYENLGFEAIVISDSDVRIGAGATYPEGKIDGKVEVDSDNKLVNGVTVYNNQGSATIQAGTQLEDATGDLKLTTTKLEESATDITLSNGESLQSFDVHVSGIAADNTVPVIITLKEFAPEFLNKGNLDLYHVENGVTVPMTRVYTQEEVDVHNEYYYDIATGTVTVAMATFSEVAVTSDDDKGWQGGEDHTWYDPNATTLYIANADQLWSFSQIVGGMATGIAQDSFAGKTVKLLADINLADNEEVNVEGGKIFYPIGYYNSDGTYEKTNKAITSSFKTFQGTFDGAGHTISNIYQNTWEMKGDNNYYAASLQYYRDGMGLFGRIYGGTVRNLTIKNFSSDGEYTTTGCVAAYADCGATFENIAIFNCNPRVYNIGNGGVVGCVGWYTNEVTDKKVTFTNVTVDNSNKISALWGSYDVACGGIVGQYYPTSGQSAANYPANPGVHFENCHVAAQMDVYNDVCANYQYYAYRYTGMMIGSVRENETINGHVYPKMDGITASGCTVHFGTWNDYYYCEIIDNTTASYTHDYQMSRLTEIKAINGTTVTYLDGTTGTVPASGRANYVIVDYEKGHGTENATCYHFKDGTVWTHDMGGIQTGIDENGDGQDDLKEDKQHIYLEFDQLFTGYGWGVSSKGIKDVEGLVDANGNKILDITILDRVEANSVPKFAPTANGKSFNIGETVTVSDLFTALSDAKVAIDTDNVQVFVSPAVDNSLAGGEYVANTSDWTKGKVTFTGHGEALITITDYYYCTPTTIKVTIKPIVELELVTHPVNTFTEYGNEAHAEATKVYVYAAAGSEMTLANSTITVPGGWTDTNGNALNGTWTGGANTEIGTNKTVLVEFLAPADEEINADTLNYAMKVQGANTAVDADCKAAKSQNTHDAQKWTPWGDKESEKTTLPSKSGRYYLTADINVSNQITLKGENINVELCLNGKTVTAALPEDKMTTSGYRDRLYYVHSGAKLTICDCTASGTTHSTYKAGTITGSSHGAIMIPNLNNPTEAQAKTTVNLYDGIFIGNTLVENGACILTQQGSTFNMYGGLITENRNVQSDNTGKTAGQGAAVYAGNQAHFNMYGGWITQNMANKGAGLWCTSGSIVNIKNGYFAGNTTWQDQTDRYMAQLDLNNLGADVEGAATRPDDALFVYNPDDHHYHYGSGAAIYATDATVNVEYTIFEDNEAWIRGGAITLTGADAKLTIVGGSFTGNKVLTHKYRPVTVTGDAVVQTVAENTEESNNTEDGVGSEGNGETGGDTSGDGGMDDGNTSSEYKLQESTGSGGAIFMHNGSKATITGTTFDGNIADLNGGAVHIVGKAEAVLDSVTVTNNKIQSNGGAGIYHAGYSKLTLQGDSSITGNYGGVEGKDAVAGIYLTNGYGEVTFKGNPKIYGNGFGTSPTSITKERNVYLQNNTGRTYDHDNDETTPKIDVPNAKIKLRDLELGMNVTVFTAGGTKAFPNEGLKWLDWKDAAFNAADHTTYYGNWDQTFMRCKNPSRAILENKETHDLYITDDHSIFHGNDSYDWYAWGDDADEKGKLPTTTGYYYLTEDVTLAEAQTISGTNNVTLCLAGHTVTAEGDRIYNVSDSANLTICDHAVATADLDSVATIGTLCTGIGEGGAIKASAGTTVNLTNIKVTGERADGTWVEEVVNGGAIYADGATVNMTDVLFTGVRTMGKTTFTTTIGTDGKTVNNYKHVGYGGVIYAENAAELTVTNVIIDDCSGGMGAAIYFNGTEKKASLTAENLTIQNCVSDAAKYVPSETETDVSNNPSDPIYSEIVHLAKVKADLNNCNILNNTTYDSLRGPIYLTGDSEVVTLTGCTIAGNKILRSVTSNNESYGVIYMTHPAKLVINGNDNDISENYLYKYDSQTKELGEPQREIYIFLQRKNADRPNQFPTLAFQGITDSDYTARFNASAEFDDVLQSDVTEDTVTVPAGTENWNRWLKAENCTASFGVLQERSGTTVVNTTYRYDLVGNTFIKCEGNHPGIASYHATDCTTEEWIAWTDTTTVPSTTGCYYLTQDVTIAERVEVHTSQNITLCLNGHNITYQEPVNDTDQYNGMLYHLKAATINLTICDCTATGDAKQYDAEENPNAYKAGTISGFTDGVLFTPNEGDNSNVKINVRDVIFKDNVNDLLVESSTSGASGGVIVSQKGAEVNIEGGLFVGNGAYASSGVIYSSADGKITASDAVFMNNTTETEESGVIRAGSTNVDLDNCTFKKNTAGIFGGAISLIGTATLTADNCTFTENTTKTYGGAIFVEDTAKLDLTECTFTNNTAQDSGGAIYMIDTAEAELTTCTFTGNNATTNGGAIYSRPTVKLTVTGGTFSDNTSEKNGGAICSSIDTYTGDAYAFTLTDVEFIDNSSGYGGAVYMKNRKDVSISDCTFTGNIANVVNKSDNETGGGLGGAICTDSCKVTLTGGSFSGNNAARSGGAIYVCNSEATIRGTCQITGNSAGTENTDTGNGGGIYVDTSSILTLETGVTVTGNTVVAPAGKTGLGADIYLGTNAVYTNVGAEVVDIYPAQTQSPEA